MEPIIHRSAHPQGDQNEVKTCSYGMEWQQKVSWYGLENLDNRMSENKNVQNIQQPQKPWKSGKWNYIIASIICNSNDATQLNT